MSWWRRIVHSVESPIKFVGREVEKEIKAHPVIAKGLANLIPVPGAGTAVSALIDVATSDNPVQALVKDVAATKTAAPVKERVASLSRFLDGK